MALRGLHVGDAVAAFAHHLPFWTMVIASPGTPWSATSCCARRSNSAGSNAAPRHGGTEACGWARAAVRRRPNRASAALRRYRRPAAKQQAESPGEARPLLRRLRRLSSRVPVRMLCRGDDNACFHFCMNRERFDVHAADPAGDCGGRRTLGRGHLQRPGHRANAFKNAFAQIDVPSCSAAST